MKHVMHGLSHTKEYGAWCKIKGRCYNKNDHKYKNYGGRGIEFEYKDDFLGFLEEVGYAPNDGDKWSIGRIDNNSGYVKGNMRWETLVTQARNRRKNSQNTSGVTGVRKMYSKTTNGKINEYYIAQWIELNGKKRQKLFPVSKHGEEVAFKLACEYRKEQIERLNLEGAEYGMSHGE